MAESTGVIAVGGGYAGVMAVDRLTRNDEVGGEAEPRPHRCPPQAGRPVPPGSVRSESGPGPLERRRGPSEGSPSTMSDLLFSRWSQGESNP